jgi:phosphatidylglycerophosphatase C
VGGASEPTVAAFDLDGTITRRDTLVPFLRRTCGTWRTATALILESPAIVGALARGSRHDAKERLVNRLLAGRNVEELESAAEAFATAVLEHGVRGSVIDRLRDHIGAGDTVVIVTASPELYVDALGRRLGVAAVIGTRLEVDGEGRLTGRFAGHNCRGAEKVARLRAWLDERGDDRPRIVAYGDSSGDAELLAFADVSTKLRRGGLPGSAT